MDYPPFYVHFDAKAIYSLSAAVPRAAAFTRLSPWGGHGSRMAALGGFDGVQGSAVLVARDLRRTPARL